MNCCRWVLPRRDHPQRDTVIMHILIFCFWSLQPTSTGLDLLPAWFLKLAAPVFCKPIAHLFNLSIYVPFVPQQWKCAWISPIPKVPTPKTHSDYRPISITSILTRIMERLVVRQFLYPAFLTDYTIFLWSICFSSLWLYHCCPYLDPPYYHPATIQPRLRNNNCTQLMYPAYVPDMDTELLP